MWSDDMTVWDYLDKKCVPGLSAAGAGCRRVLNRSEENEGNAEYHLKLSSLRAMWVQVLDGQPHYVVKSGLTPKLLMFAQRKGAVLAVTPHEEKLSLQVIGGHVVLGVPTRFFELMVSMCDAGLYPFILWWTDFSYIYTLNSMDVCTGDVLKRMQISRGNLTIETTRKLMAMTGMASGEGFGPRQIIMVNNPLPEEWMDGIVKLGHELIQRKDSLLALDASTRASILVKAATQIPWIDIQEDRFTRPRLVKSAVEDVLTDATGTPLKDAAGNIRVVTETPVTMLVKECKGCGKDEALQVCDCGCGNIYCDECECPISCKACEEKCGRGERRYCYDCISWTHRKCDCLCRYCSICLVGVTSRGQFVGHTCSTCMSIFCNRCREGVIDDKCVNCRAHCETCGNKMEADRHWTMCSNCCCFSPCKHDYHLLGSKRFCTGCFIGNQLRNSTRSFRPPSEPIIWATSAPVSPSPSQVEF